MDSEKIEELLFKLKEEMKLRGFTFKTVEAYNWHVTKFLEFGASKRDYLLNLISSGRSSASVRLASAAIGFYEKNILKVKGEKIPIPKNKRSLPQVLTKNQIISMIDSTSNEKHKIIVELLYSSGLRLEELVNLKYEHIDFENNIIYVKQGKGQKDRITIISQRVLDRLDLQGQGYVLKGRKGKYTKKSVQETIKKLSEKAGIRQKVSPHLLRHSFATSLLESGVNIRYIQALLGHERLETTQIYTKVAKHDLKKIKNPFD